MSEGDLVVLDFGGVYASYCVDLTRTVSIGPATSRAREVYSAVLEAHDRAIAAVRPGASRLDIDAAARDTLGRYGMAEAFGHGTGHGLGIEVHEDPRITQRRPDDRSRHARRSGRGRHGLHDRAGRVLAGLGRRPNRRRRAGDGTASERRKLSDATSTDRSCSNYLILIRS